MTLGLLIAIAAAAAESGTPPVVVGTEGEAWRTGERPPIDGIMGLEAKLEHLDRRIDEVVMLSPTWAQAMRDVDPAAADARPNESLSVEVQRVWDGAVLGQQARQPVPWRGTPSTRQRSCATAPVTDSRPVELSTWDDRLRPQGGPIRRELGTGDPAVFYLQSGEGPRTALVELAPGESVTLVELIDAPQRQPRRQLRVHRGDRTLTVTEGASVQQVCIEGGVPSTEAIDWVPATTDGDAWGPTTAEPEPEPAPIWDAPAPIADQGDPWE